MPAVVFSELCVLSKLWLALPFHYAFWFPRPTGVAGALHAGPWWSDMVLLRESSMTYCVLCARWHALIAHAGV